MPARAAVPDAGRRNTRFVGLALAGALGVMPLGIAVEEEPGAPEAPEGSPEASGFTFAQARSAVEEHVNEAVRASSGVYRLPDPVTGRMIEMEFVRISIVSTGNLWKVHDPDRRVDAGSFFACTLFHAVGAPPGKQYDVDMLVEPRDGKLAVSHVRLHKEKQLVDGKWVWRPRTAAGAVGGPTQR